MIPDQLSVTFAALADPTRRAILSRLSRGEASVTELAKPFDLSLPGVSKHLKVLQRAGLVRQSRKAQWRPCRLDGARLKEAAEWVVALRPTQPERRRVRIPRRPPRPRRSGADRRDVRVRGCARPRAASNGELRTAWAEDQARGAVGLSVGLRS